MTGFVRITTMKQARSESKSLENKLETIRRSVLLVSGFLDRIDNEMKHLAKLKKGKV